MRLIGKHPTLLDLTDLAQLIEEKSRRYDGNLFIVTTVDDEQWCGNRRREGPRVVVLQELIPSRNCRRVSLLKFREIEAGGSLAEIATAHRVDVL